MGVFSAETIYGHMNAAHGGIHDEEVVPEQVNYEEQELVLQQAREARELLPLPPLPELVLLPPPPIQPVPVPVPAPIPRERAVDDAMREYIRRVNEAEAQRRAARAAEVWALAQQQRHLEAVREAAAAEEQRLAAARRARAAQLRAQVRQQWHLEDVRAAEIDYLREAQAGVNERANERERMRREEEGGWGCMIM